jgi:D-tyrosyl-tRNA(Tyr) deacylase
MIGLLQRVTTAKVEVNSELVGEIGAGLVVFACVQRDDTPATVDRLADRILGYRVFADETGRMNRCLKETGGGLLLVSQFTLAADTRKGTRASFSTAAPPELGELYFDRFVHACRQQHGDVQTGRFAADMQVSLVNDGPVTFWLET